ncbi:MAG: anti-sigma factor antagonist [Desulfobacteraceae bacterium]|jgi:anti-anti-sigma factor|nr:MAG: anti-sigma factor antagonist [Desulfobacteraceae bacterium]
METAKRKEKTFTILSVSGRLDAITSSELEKELSAMIAGGEKSLILDFEALDYISSAGLRCILAAAKKLREKQGTLRLACLKGVVKEVFDISGFDSVIPCFNTAGGAVEG